MIHVVVPSPVWLDEEISWIHGHWLAIGGRVGAAAFNDETERWMGVSMGRRDFAGEHDLNSHADRSTARLQAAVPAESVGASPHHLCGFDERRINLRPTPELRL